MGIVAAIRQSLRRNRPLRLDFTTLREVSPAASLVLAAELDRWRRIRQFRPRVLDYEKWDAEISRLLYEMGLFDLLQVSNPPLHLGAGEPSVSFIRFRSHVGAAGDEAKQLRLSLEALTGRLPNTRVLYRALSEAMSNVRHHAYPNHVPRWPAPILKDRWWMAGSYEHVSGRLRILFYDQGWGIPRTLVREHGIEQVRQVLNLFNLVPDDDAKMIKAALNLGRTRTGNPHQGKGLPDMLKLASQRPGATLRILSGKGEYIYTCDGPEQLRVLTVPLDGTLIQWEMDI
ncbi:hypothetical protein [Ferrovibrio sp.]|uniref:hypothetical protein n=1 Tax=Ferrovibrio sp. TaxID=1917215 RepID=UPI003918F6F4